MGEFELRKSGQKQAKLRTGIYKKEYVCRNCGYLGAGWKVPQREKSIKKGTRNLFKKKIYSEINNVTTKEIYLSSEN